MRGELAFHDRPSAFIEKIGHSRNDNLHGLRPKITDDPYVTAVVNR
jgi:hypothetical protein